MENFNLFTKICEVGIIAACIAYDYHLYRTHKAQLDDYENSRRFPPNRSRYLFAWSLWILCFCIPIILLFWFIRKDFPHNLWIVPLILLPIAFPEYPFYTIVTWNGKINGPGVWNSWAGGKRRRVEINLKDIDKEKVLRRNPGAFLGITILYSKSGAKILTLGLDKWQLEEILALADKETEFTLRKATPEDAPAIASLTDAAYSKYIPRLGRKPQPMTADYARMAAEHPIWLLHHGQELAGLLVLEHEPAALLIYSVAVSPQYQKQGLGRRLMALAEEQARLAGYRSIRLYTNEHMLENVALYLKLGYHEDRREPYLGSNLVHMSKRLEP